MFNLGVDLTFIGRDARGMGRFVRNILDAFMNKKKGINIIGLYNPTIEKSINLENHLRKWKLKPVSFNDYDKYDCKIVWFPWSRVDFMPDCVKAVNIYDVNPFLFKNKDSEKDKKRLISAAKKSDIIFTTSVFSAQNIITYLDVDYSKIRVIYPGIDKVFKKLNLSDAKKEKERKKAGINDKFMLFVGSMDERKNLKGLLKSFAVFKEATGSNICLVIAGNSNGKNLFSFFDKNDAFTIAKQLKFNKDIIWMGEITDEKLNILYNMAEFLVFPSFHEGFGFPVAEAMKTGLPVICSDRASLPEITKGSVLYCDPDDINDISMKMTLMEKDLSLRKKIILAASSLAEKFSFELCKKEYVSVFKKCLEKKLHLK